MWNLKNKINKQNRNRFIDAEKKLMVARRGREEWNETGIKKCKLVGDIVIALYNVRWLLDLP